MNVLLQLWRDDAGQDLVEYALLIVLVAITVIAALNLLSAGISSVFTRITDCLKGLPSTC